MRIIVAPDSFKGTATAASIAAAVRAGWLTERPDDDVVLAPMADGGEGTLDAFETAVPGAVRVPVTVTGPAGTPVDTHWLRLPDGRGVVELAATSGLPLLDAPMPDTATSRGFGEAIAAALDAGATGLVLGIGGSASTDGGRPVLEALGLDSDGAGTGDLRALPPLGVTVLTDVASPLLGPTGAAAVFGPQKGITPDRVAYFDERLATWAARFPDVDPDTPGSGAAGGVGFGLLVWGATLAGGAAAVAEVLGLPALLDGADVVISGEGCFDGQSAVGKVPSVVRDLTAAHAPGARSMLVAGAIEAPLHDYAAAASLTVLATQTTGEPDDALADPLRFATIAGQRLARLA
ncbi:glycerate kinase [Curtobacterium flaccumfaciens]|uniref:glycerate kinase n=1 Tax=Curtobacterium flaccumfaciens TaxID=2035 RepID=UPI000FFE79F7|nr:glycerate kinase [Curtobacterium flaccumfaciens]MCS0645184.1 glycerate kinase [Curtobacterium flaccumfaciens pv. flaccumfaciens]MCS6527198.1 glycerate kinase [Curtobacterium flaccumfaciens pv. flaccumfaciens]MCS6531093.1 glycerate kinase [Curtobacterium flaccumfaciens pv. flaccumfaciens]NUU09153.1 glycerate kinase [Curtobacterium flaccumfaciens]RXF82852.1 glycerate kinase [Curtobacterium flaccumfaciens pv. flaccumfaciens]